MASEPTRDLMAALKTSLAAAITPPDPRDLARTWFEPAYLIPVEPGPGEGERDEVGG